MNSVGIGGFFMHARGVLQTEYLGGEWFDNVESSICEVKNLVCTPLLMMKTAGRAVSAAVQ